VSRDPFLDETQQEFNSNEGAPKWELKPNETVCKVCWIVKPCDC
jgi:hypothetical protein